MAKAETSKRIANKIDKKDRILKAARELFKERGFEKTTMREVASRAGVAAGTLFLYAEHKEALLMIIFREELVPLFEGAFASTTGESLQADLMHVFGYIADHHLREPDLCIHFVRQAYVLGKDERAKVSDVVHLWLNGVKRIIEGAKGRHEIPGTADSTELATYCIDLFLAMLRRRLIGSIDAAAFERNLANALATVVAGANALASENEQGDCRGT